MINLNHLRIFYYAVKHQNFTKAAERLFISQPAVTSQIKAFEDQLNIKLFYKRGRKVYPTAESEILFEYARKVFDSEAEFENVVEEMQGLKRGVLRIGAAKAYARYLLPTLISSFLHYYPYVQIKVDEGSSMELVNNLLEFKNDIAIIVKTVENKNIHFEPFLRSELVLIVAPDHPFARKESIYFSDMRAEKLVMKEVGSATRMLVDDLFAKHECVPNILMETSNSEFIKQMVRQGEGLAFLSRPSVQAEISEKTLGSVSIKESKMFMDANIVYVANRNYTNVVSAFLDFTGKLVPKGSPLHDINDLKAKVVALQKKEVQ